MDEKIAKITKHQFYFETALYDRVGISDLEDNVFRGEFLGFNPIKKYRTTFTVQRSDLAYRGHTGRFEGAEVLMERAKEKFWDSSLDGISAILLTCKQSGDQIMIFVIEDKDSITKIGQTPSLADIKFAEVSHKYEKQLTKEDLKNYKMAIFGHSHGVGIGSFVYLRRIFENLITDIFTEHAAALGLNEEAFRRLRMEEKVDALKSVLPSQLVEMKVAYGILSKGLHELTDEECLKYFMPIRLSIELILDQKIEKMEKDKKDAMIKNELKRIANDLGGH